MKGLRFPSYLEERLIFMELRFLSMMCMMCGDNEVQRVVVDDCMVQKGSLKGLKKIKS